jgi:hypothetical protein
MNHPRSVFFACLALATACDPESPVEASSFRTATAFQTHHEWHQPNDTGPHDETIVLADSNEEVCFLTGMAGRFSGGGESVALEIVDGKWQLRGKSQQLGMSAAVDCFDREAFDQDGVHASLKNLSEDVTGYSSEGSDCWHGVETLLPGDYAAALAGITGALRGGAEYVETLQASTLTNDSQLVAHSCQGPVWGNATMTRVSYDPTPGYASDVAQFIGPDGEGTAAIAGEWEAFSAGASSVEMASAEQAVCFLKRVAGEFNGGGERAFIDLGPSHRWVLHAEALSGDGVWAEAMCLNLDQHCPVGGCEQIEFDPPRDDDDGGDGDDGGATGYRAVEVFNCHDSPSGIVVWHNTATPGSDGSQGGPSYQGEGFTCPVRGSTPLVVPLEAGFNQITVVHQELPECDAGPPGFPCQLVSQAFPGDPSSTATAQLVVH